MKSKGSWLAAALVVYLGLTSAWADERGSTNILEKSLVVYGGAQLYQADGKFGYVEEGQPDITVDLDDLGLADDKVSPAVGALINFWENRLTLRLDYFGYHDDANATIDFEFDFDGITYPAGASLDSSLDLDLYVVNLSYNFYRSNRARFGVGLGVHAADIDIKISGKTYVGATEIDLGTGRADILAPLPNFYVTGAYAFTDRVLLRCGGGGFSMKYNDWDGSLWFANAFLEYWPWQYVGIGAGYRYLSANVEYDPGHKKETYDFDLPGPVFYVTAGF